MSKAGCTTVVIDGIKKIVDCQLVERDERDVVGSAQAAVAHRPQSAEAGRTVGAEERVGPCGVARDALPAHRRDVFGPQIPHPDKLLFERNARALEGQFVPEQPLPFVLERLRSGYDRDAPVPLRQEMLDARFDAASVSSTETQSTRHAIGNAVQADHRTPASTIRAI